RGRRRFVDLRHLLLGQVLQQRIEIGRVGFLVLEVLQQLVEGGGIGFFEFRPGRVVRLLRLGLGRPRRRRRRGLRLDRLGRRRQWRWLRRVNLGFFQRRRRHWRRRGGRGRFGGSRWLGLRVGLRRRRCGRRL